MLTAQPINDIAAAESGAVLMIAIQLGYAELWHWSTGAMSLKVARLVRAFPSAGGEVKSAGTMITYAEELVRHGDAPEAILWLQHRRMSQHHRN
eukprot:gene10221-biopygen5210